jgi:hypothetical protein
MVGFRTIFLVSLAWRAWSANDAENSTENMTDDNISQSSGGMEVKFMGKSGKFAVFRKAEGEKDKNQIKFEIAELRELAADGVTEVGAKAKPKHQLKNFKKTEFSFDVVQGAAVGEATATKVSFKSNIEGVGTLKVDTFLMATKGEVGLDVTDDTLPSWSAFPGDVKFNIEFESWKFCGGGEVTCTNKGKDEVGEFIDLDIEIKGPKTKPEKKDKKKGKGAKGGKGKTFDLGGGVGLDMSPDILLDGSNNTMPDGYPMLQTKGSKQIFTFRFPKFVNKTIYDPLLGTSEEARKLLENPDPSPTPTPPPPPSDPTLVGAAEHLVLSTSVILILLVAGSAR